MNIINALQEKGYVIMMILVMIIEIKPIFFSPEF